VLWAQRKHVLYVKIVVPEMVEGTGEYRFSPDGLYFTAESTKDGGATYTIDLTMFRKIQPEGCFAEERSQDFSFILQKKWEWIYWPRLLRSPSDPVKANVGVDWKRWKSEEEDDDSFSGNPQKTKGVDDAWWDEELSQKKPAVFPEEAYDDLHLPLVNATEFTSFLNTEKQVVALFFSRKLGEGPSQLWHKVMATMSKDQELTKHWSFVTIDGGARENSKLLKKLHITSFPQVKTFYENGDMFGVEIEKLKSGKDVKGYLMRQNQPAYRVIETWNEADEWMHKFPRTVWGFVDDQVAPDAIALTKKKKGLSKEKLFEMVAKRFRARVEPQMVKFGKINTHIPELLEHFNKTDGYSGVVVQKLDDVVKTREWPQHRKLKEKALFEWVYSVQFNVIEFITPHNFADFRRRNLPILYIILDAEDTASILENNWELIPILEEMQPLAQSKYMGKVSVVFTFQSDPRLNSADLSGHLRCDFHNKTMAVLEDFHEDYRYCVETYPERPLTVHRIEKLVDEVLANTAEPDKVKSEEPPKNNPGPLYHIVADNLLNFVMEERDVVVHFYSAIDEEWEFQEYQLNRFLHEVEDLSTLVVGKMDGLKNERPKSFPDLGYFPCTWIFPKNHKNNPIYFNKTYGFDKERLMDWVRRTADVSITPNGIWPNGTAVDGSAWDASGKTTLPDYYAGHEDPNIKAQVNPELGQYDAESDLQQLRQGLESPTKGKVRSEPRDKARAAAEKARGGGDGEL